MLGAIFGDIVGSVYEFNNTNNYNFKLLSRHSEATDDTMMTLAVAKGLLEAQGLSDEEVKDSIIDAMKEVGQRYPDAGYGGMFYRWVLSDDRKPYRSYGNGSAMRVSAAGWLYDTLEETLHYARLSAEVTHNHPEGIKGAEATAAAIFLARTGKSKTFIKTYIVENYGYDLSKTVKEISRRYHGEEICQISVPDALICFLESESYIDTIRKAVSIGGDSDTLACIAGGIAEAYYGMDEEYQIEAVNRLDDYQKEILKRFHAYLQQKETHEDYLEKNRMLREAIALLYEENSKEHLLHVYETLVCLMQLHGSVLMPCISNKIPIDPDEIKAGDTIQLEEDLHLKFVTYEDGQGNSALPCFTDEEELRAADLANNVVLSCSLYDMLSSIVSDEGIQGLLINPANQSFLLERGIIPALLEEADSRKMQSRMSGKNACFVNLPGMKSEVLEAIAEYMNNHCEEILEAWATGLENEQEVSYAIALHLEEGADEQKVMRKLDSFVSLLKMRYPVDYFVSKTEPWVKAILFYRKKC